MDQSLCIELRAGTLGHPFVVLGHANDEKNTAISNSESDYVATGGRLEVNASNRGISDLSSERLPSCFRAGEPNPLGFGTMWIIEGFGREEWQAIGQRVEEPHRCQAQLHTNSCVTMRTTMTHI